MAFYDKYVAEREMAKSGISWFKFDEASGNVTDSKGTAVGTVTGATRVTCISGNALSFVSSSSQNVQFATKVIPLGKRSIRFRFQRNGTPTSNEYIYSNCIGSAYHGDNVYVNSSGQIVWISNKATSGTPRFTLTSTINICDNQWHDILLTWDGTTNIDAVKMRIDDMNVANVAGTALSTETVTQQYNLTLGRTYASTTPTYSNYLTGLIDEFEVYSAVINPFSYKTLILSSGEYRKWNPTILESYPQRSKNNFTSSTSNGDIVTASSIFSSAHDGWKVFDGDSSTGWATPLKVITGWLKYEFNIATKINKYKIHSATTTATATRNPKNWTFEGSNDNSNWTVLDTRSNVSFALDESKEYLFVNEVSFKYYRLNISANNGDIDHLQVNELYLYEHIPFRPFSWQAISSTLPTINQFVDEGMDSLSPLLDRRIETIEPQPMTDKTVILLPSGDVGKVFSQTLDLNKYFNIRKIEVK